MTTCWDKTGWEAFLCVCHEEDQSPSHDVGFILFHAGEVYRLDMNYFWLIYFSYSNLTLKKALKRNRDKIKRNRDKGNGGLTETDTLWCSALIRSQKYNSKSEVMSPLIKFSWHLRRLLPDQRRCIRRETVQGQITEGNVLAPETQKLIIPLTWVESAGICKTGVCQCTCASVCPDTIRLPWQRAKIDLCREATWLPGCHSNPGICPWIRPVQEVIYAVVVSLDFGTLINTHTHSHTHTMRTKQTVEP